MTRKANPAMRRTTVYLDLDTVSLLELHREFTGSSMSNTIRRMTRAAFLKDARYSNAQGVKKPRTSGGDGEAGGRPGEVSRVNGDSHE